MHWDAKLDDGTRRAAVRPADSLAAVPLRRPRRAVHDRPIGAGAAGPQVQDVESGALTYGHRFLATSGRAGRSIKVRSFDEYQARLTEHFVVLDHAERRDRIARELEMHARRLGGRVQLKEHAALIEEVADLVEYPAVVAGFFDAGFLVLPEEVLTTTLVHHQHWFPVVTDTGELKEAFLAVVNTQPADERVIAKNAERVVAARLRDAKFFWEADRKQTLESRLERLHTVLFHKKLGSYRDKAERIEKLAAWIAPEAFGRPDIAAHAATAARLAKADLTTDMVFEFPELQGTMGGIYAREEGQPEAVWKAIYHHYLPIGVEADAPPTRAQLGEAAATWAAVSLADKLDTVVGLTNAGEKADRLARSVRAAPPDARHRPDPDGPAGAGRRRPRARRCGRLLEAATRGFGGGGRALRDDAVVAFASGARALRARAARLARSRSCAARLRRWRCRAAARPAHRGGAADGCGRPTTSRRSRCSSSASRTSRANSRRARRSIASALTEPAEQALLAELDARRPRIEQAVAGGGLPPGAHRDRRRCGRSVDRFFTEVFVMADDARLRPRG